MTEPNTAPIKVEIDVYDDFHLVEEAEEVGCTAVKVSSLFSRTQYHISGPTDVVAALLKGWGYDEEYMTIGVVTQ